MHAHVMHVKHVARSGGTGLSFLVLSLLLGAGCWVLGACERRPTQAHVLMSPCCSVPVVIQDVYGMLQSIVVVAVGSLVFVEEGGM